jgi:8-oxo-dGTP diphosphatase
MIMRGRATAVIINNNQILLMKRNNHGKKYYAFIGGGIDDPETPEQAVVREVYEETSLKVKIVKQLYKIPNVNNENHFVFLCEYLGGEPALQKGTNEYTDHVLGKNTYIPTWVSLDEIKQLTIYPDVIKQKLITNFL